MTDEYKKMTVRLDCKLLMVAEHFIDEVKEMDDNKIFTSAHYIIKKRGMTGLIEVALKAYLQSNSIRDLF